MSSKELIAQAVAGALNEMWGGETHGGEPWSPEGSEVLTITDAVLAAVSDTTPSEGWSTEDRRNAEAEAKRRWHVEEPRTRTTQEGFDNFNQGCINGFRLGAEWWKATHTEPAKGECVCTSAIAGISDGPNVDCATHGAPTPSEGEREVELLADIVQRWDEPGHSREVYAGVAKSIVAHGFHLSRPIPVDREKLEDQVADTLAYYQCRETNPKADHPRMGYHAFSEDQREHLKAQKAEAAAEIVRMMLAVSPAPARDDLASRIRAVLDQADKDETGAAEYIDPAARRLQVANRALDRIDHIMREAPAPARDEWEYICQTDKPTANHLTAFSESLEQARKTQSQRVHMGHTNGRIWGRRKAGPWLPVTEGEQA